MSKKKKRLINLEINELSMVDSPAIGETFIITKNVKRGLRVNKKVTLNKATKLWNESISKAVDQKNEKCLFCGITKEEENKTLGLGLLCGVCFNCAFERMEKKVFDQCIEGTFDFEKFKSEYPDDDIFKSGDVEDEEKKDDDVNEDEKKDDVEDEEKKDDDVSDDEKKEDEEDDETKEDEEKNDGFIELESELSKLKEGNEKLEKSLDDVKEMLSTSLGIHEQTAMGFNEIVGLTFGALDLVTNLIDTDKEDTAKCIKEIKEKISQEDVSKAGAKISSSRLQTLRDIAEKLSQLIESVSGESMKESKEKNVKSIDELKNISKNNTEMIKGMEEKLIGLVKNVEALSLAGGVSNALDDEIEDQSEINKFDKVDFSDIVGISDIKKRYESKLKN